MKTKTKTYALVILLGPAVVLYALIYLYPTVRTALMSFFSVRSLTTEISQWVFVGLDNYIALFKSGLFLQSVVNLVKIWGIGGVLVLAVAMLFALILTSGVKGKRFFRSVIYLPNVISAVALGTMWLQYVFNSQFGLFKNIFEALGLNGLAAYQWTAQEHIFSSMLIAYSFGMVGYFMLSYMAGIERIPEDYYEAAGLEGASAVQSFYHITLPLMTGVIRTNVVLWTVRSLGFFIWSQIFSPVTAEMQTITPMVYMYQVVFGTEYQVDSAPGIGAAVGVLMVLATIVMFALSNVIFRDSADEF